MTTSHANRSSIRGSSKYTLAFVAFFAVAAAALAWSDSAIILRLPMGLLAVLFLPGYALSVVVFPRSDDLSGAERNALSIGLSLGLILLLILLLSYTPWGLRFSPVVFALTGLTLITVIIAWLRIQYLGTGEQPVVRTKNGESQGFGLLGKVRLTILSAILLLALGALAFVLMSPQPGMTEFYITGVDGLAKDYVWTGRPGEAVTVFMGITNRENITKTYYATVESETTILALTKPVQLPAGETWQRPTTFFLPGAEKEQKIVFKLFTEGQSEPSRQLTLWINVKSEEGAY